MHLEAQCETCAASCAGWRGQYPKADWWRLPGAFVRACDVMHVTGGCGCSFNTMHHGGSNTYDDDTSIAAAQAVPQLQPQTFETRRVLALVWGGVMMMAATMVVVVVVVVVVVAVEVVVMMMLVIATTDAAAIQTCPPSASRLPDDLVRRKESISSTKIMQGCGVA
jgi:hypothetical protein